MVEAERVKFEAWAVSLGKNVARYSYFDEADALYCDEATRQAWLGWKTHAMHDAAPKVEVQPVGAVAANCKVHWLNWSPQDNPHAWLYTHPAAPIVESEPVAWLVTRLKRKGDESSGRVRYLHHTEQMALDDFTAWADIDGAMPNIAPLYTHPAAPQPAALPEQQAVKDALQVADDLERWGSNLAKGEMLKLPGIHAVEMARRIRAALKGKQ